MEQYEAILSRADLQQIASFLISGEELVMLDGGSSMQRIRDLQKTVNNLLEQAVPEFDRRNNILCKMNELNSTTQNAYLELGLRAAFRMTQA